MIVGAGGMEDLCLGAFFRLCNWDNFFLHKNGTDYFSIGAVQEDFFILYRVKIVLNDYWKAPLNPHLIVKLGTIKVLIYITLLFSTGLNAAGL